LIIQQHIIHTGEMKYELLDPFLLSFLGPML